MHVERWISTCLHAHTHTHPSFLQHLPAMAGTPCALNQKYHVFRTAVQHVRGPPGCPVFLIDCEIKYKLSESSAKKLGRDYSDAVDVCPVLTRNRGQPSRWDLKANMSYANNHTCLYTRAVGFTLLRRNGRRLSHNASVSGFLFER